MRTTTKKKRYRRQLVVEANEFRVVDNKGNIRALLGIGSRGPCLLLFDGKRSLRVSAFVHGTQPGIELLDKNGKVRTALHLDQKGHPSLLLLDCNEKVNLGLALKKDGEPRLDLYDPNEKLRGSFALDKVQESSHLTVVDLDGNCREPFGSGETLEPMISFYGTNGEGEIMVGPGVNVCKDGRAS